MEVKDFIKTYCDDEQRFEIRYINSKGQDDTSCDDKGKEDTLELLEYLGLEHHEISGIKTISYGEEDYLVIRLANY